MSILQGGSGLPFFAPPVYNYLVHGSCTGISIDTADVPDPALKSTLEKVSRNVHEVFTH